MKTGKEKSFANHHLTSSSTLLSCQFLWDTKSLCWSTMLSHHTSSCCEKSESLCTALLYLVMSSLFSWSSLISGISTCLHYACSCKNMRVHTHANIHTLIQYKHTFLNSLLFSCPCVTSYNLSYHWEAEAEGSQIQNQSERPNPDCLMINK